MKGCYIMYEIQIIKDIKCYTDEQGIVWLNLDNIARGLGFTKTDYKNGKEYIRIHSANLKRWLTSFGLLKSENEKLPEYIPEPYLYLLGMKAENQTAKDFQNAVAFEVIPQIRKTGGYIPISQEDDERTILAKAIKIADKTISQKDALIKQLEPKAKMFDMFMDSSGTYSMNQVAKELKIGEYKLFQFLRDNKVLFYEGSDSVPYQRFVDNGCFKVVATIDPKGVSHSTTRILPKGMKYIAKLLSKSERTVA